MFKSYILGCNFLPRPVQVVPTDPGRHLPHLQRVPMHLMRKIGGKQVGQSKSANSPHLKPISYHLYGRLITRHPHKHHSRIDKVTQSPQISNQPSKKVILKMNSYLFVSHAWHGAGTLCLRVNIPEIESTKYNFTLRVPKILK